MEDKLPHGPENTYSNADELREYYEHLYPGCTITIDEVRKKVKNPLVPRNTFQVVVTKTEGDSHVVVHSNRITIRR